MNRQQAVPVETPVRRLLYMTGILLGLLATGACVEVDGGAVELSWTLRTFEGEPIATCADAKIGKIRVNWAPSSANGADQEPDAVGFEEFACPANRGVTHFAVGQGPQLLWIEPICEDGSPAVESTYEVPPPILRYVQNGEVVTLDSLLVVADDSSNGCTKAQGCTCDTSSMAGGSP